jgi:protease I
MNSNDIPDRYPECYLPISIELKEELVGDGYPLPEFEDQGSEYLKGFRVALITTHGPELPEFHVPVNYLRDRGASVEVLTPDWIFDKQEGETSGMVVLAQWLAVKVCVRADKKISDAKIEDYDAIIIIGGAWNPIMLRTDQSVLRFIYNANIQGILIASICHGPQVLISTKAFSATKRNHAFPDRTRVTGVDDIKEDLRNAGFIVVKNKPVVYDEDQRLITSPDPKKESLQRFCEETGKQGYLLLQGKTRSMNALKPSNLKGKSKDIMKPLRQFLLSFISAEKDKYMKLVLQLFLLVAQIIMLINLFQHNRDDKYSWDLILSIAIVSTILLLTLVVDHLQSISIGKDGLKAEIRELRDVIKANETELFKLISLSMGDHTYCNLRKFVNENGTGPRSYGDYKKPHHQGLESELYYLRNLGYVEFIKDNEDKVKSIYDIPPNGEEGNEGNDLSKYIRVTKQGIDYVNLREKIEGKIDCQPFWQS